MSTLDLAVMGFILVCQRDRDRIDRSSRRQPPLEVAGGRSGGIVNLGRHGML